MDPIFLVGSISTSIVGGNPILEVLGCAFYKGRSDLQGAVVLQLCLQGNVVVQNFNAEKIKVFEVRISFSNWTNRVLIFLMFS